MNDQPEHEALSREDRVILGLIEEQMQWGPRNPIERRAFEARLAERLEPRPAWQTPALGFVAAAAAAALLWMLPSTTPTSEPTQGLGFLSAAYYAGDANASTSNSESSESDRYLPDEFRALASALDATDEGIGGTL
jgi:hypothetical protein